MRDEPYNYKQYATLRLPTLTPLLATAVFFAFAGFSVLVWDDLGGVTSGTKNITSGFPAGRVFPH